MVYDAADAAVEFLRTSTKERAVAIRNLVVGGVDGIIDSGGAQARFISSQEERRRSDGTPGKVLAIAVQDAGEDLTGSLDIVTQYIVVRIIDRQMGLSNIRKVRAQLIPLLKKRVFNVADSVGGIIQLRYAGRTGHLLDLDFAVHYEAITFEATVTLLNE